MPHARTSPPADRFFARLDRFECECPHCGKLIYSAMDRRAHTVRMQALRRRQKDRLSPRSRRLRHAVWNPCTQRLACPWCGKVYVAGLLLYPGPSSPRQPLEPPPDVVPTAREIAVSRLKAGGWYASQRYERGGEVNVAVESPCSCPLKGWSATCPVHGDPAVVALQLG